MSRVDETSRIGISDDRLKHMRKVGQLCAEFGAIIYGWGANKQAEMFVLGLLHDFGYHFVQHQSRHGIVGGDILKRTGFKYHAAVAQHGQPIERMSPELLCLNLADMSVDSRGRIVTLDERIQDMASRYGKDSAQTKTAQLVIDLMRKQLAGLGKNIDQLEKGRVTRD